MNVDFHTMVRNGLGLLIAISGLLMCACSTPPGSRVDVADAPAVSRDKTSIPAVIEGVRTEAQPHQATVTFVCSKETGYGQPRVLTDPARICFHIRGMLSQDFPHEQTFRAGPVAGIHLEETVRGATAVVVHVRHDANQTRLFRKGRDIVLEVIPSSVPKAQGEGKQTSSVQPDRTVPQILGVNVTQRAGNRTRLSILSDRNVPYDVKLDGNILKIDLENGTINPELMKQIDAEYVEGAVKRVQAFYSAADRHITLRVTLRQLIPYHITQDGATLTIDFDAITGTVTRAKEKMPESAKRVPPAVKATGKEESPPETPAVGPPAKIETEEGPADTSDARRTQASRYAAASKQYAGQRMSFDFVDTDIRNILQLISEVAKINIVWGSDVAGKISMKLDNIPWDQALEMVLRPNGLTYQIEDDVLWVVPKERLRDLEIKEGKRKGALMAAKRLQGVFEAKIIEFITIKHRNAEDVFRMLVGDPDADPPIPPALDIEAAESHEEEEGEEEKGKSVKISTRDLYLSYDSGTNVIIANGVRAKVDKVKELITRLDVPEKQVMIEARVVDAQTNFVRDLGIRWRSLDEKNPGFKREWYNTGANFEGVTQFSTNAPSTAWTPNIGLAFGWLTNGGLGSIALDASLALGETDGKVHIISAPKVLTVNGGEAVISRGTVAYKEISTLDTIDVREMTAALQLTVKPTISADNSHVTMQVKVSDDKMFPDLSGKTEKTVETTLMVRTGETVVIGGIFYKYTSEADSGVPWVKDIPILGWLFKAQEDTREKSELLIFLTPTVVDPLKMASGQ